MLVHRCVCMQLVSSMCRRFNPRASSCWSTSCRTMPVSRSRRSISRRNRWMRVYASQGQRSIRRLWISCIRARPRWISAPRDACRCICKRSKARRGAFSTDVMVQLWFSLRNAQRERGGKCVMSSRRWLARSLACSLCGLSLVAFGDTDPSFLLSTTKVDLDSYFPTYLANGYFSTMTDPRGTENNLAYVVAFMDYAKEDIARPAAIPGWSGIDYSTGKSTAGEFWLNSVKLDPKAFADYRQTLNMREGTLTTSYRFTDASKKSTAIRVSSLASEASPHLAATQMSITPAFSGTVQLAFTFKLWAPHQPRFPIRTMTGDEMLAAVAANNMSVVEPVNHSTPDRAPVWYYGHTHVLAHAADSQELSFWLDGRAE